MVKQFPPFFVFLFFVLSSNLLSQELRTHRDIYYIYDQLIPSDSSFHYTIKPYSPEDIPKFDSLARIHTKHRIYNKLFNEDLIGIKNKQFLLNLNPIISANYYSNNSEFIQDYKAGINIQTSYGKKIYFVSDIFYSDKTFFENTKQFIDSFSVIPYYGRYIEEKDDHYRFYNLTGEFIFRPGSNVYFHIGRGKTFIGNGYRSLFLSDNSNAYPYFKTTVDIWKIKYIWMYAKLSDFELYNGENRSNLYDKAAFIHYFSLNLTKRINFNFFEALITNPYDLEGRRKGYELSYFNPVIFYRPVEFYSGSSDNSLMGIGLNIRLWNFLYLYSQFILDDLVISSIKDGTGWWGNKYGLQGGFKAYNIFKVKGLFVRGEINAVSPYTYSHGEAYSKNGIINLNYGHYRQNLAHPLGANFIESLFIIRYMKRRFNAKAKFMYAKVGEDVNLTSYGNDIYKVYNLRPSDYGIKFFQGEINTLNIYEISAAYIINPKYNLMIETKINYYQKDNPYNKENHLIFHFGITTKIFNEG